jgi:putative ABC transport system permease protein
VLDTVLTDVRFAVRVLCKAPTFSAIAVGTLALGIGATTAMFSLVDHVLLRPLTYRDADRLYTVHEVVPKFSHLAPLLPVNAMHFGEWRRGSRALAQSAMIGGTAMNLTGDGEPERVAAARVSPTLFSMLGVQARLGRTFLEEEDQPGRDGVVVLDDAFWRRRFSANPAVVGKTIHLDGKPYAIVGVLPPDFRFPKLSQLYSMPIAEERPQIWKPFAVRQNELEPLGDFNFACIVALRPGVSIQQAVAELDAIQARVAAAAPARIELQAALVPLQDQITGRSRTSLQVLFAAVAAVLLIGCVNIANLLLARSAGRRRELAVRTAIGASRVRLLRQQLTESVLLSIAGGCLGGALAYAGVGWLTAHAPVDLPRLDELRVDVQILAFTCAVSMAAGLAAGLLPAWRSAGIDPLIAMRSSSRSASAGPAARRVRNLLVCAEVALAALCLSVGGLLLHSYVKLLRVDVGFEAASLATVALNMPDQRYPDAAARTRFLRSALESTRALPGILSVGVASQLPLGGEGGNNLITAEGTNPPLTDRPLADVREVNPEYFATLGIPLQSGRIFSEADQAPVAVISALTAQRLWPGQDAIGRRIRVGDPESPLVLVTGVVGDVHGVALVRRPNPTVYRPYWQRSRSQATLVFRTRISPQAVNESIASTIHRIDAELPVPAVRTMDEIVSSSVATERFQAMLVVLFGVTAALLAGLGVYGVVAHSVAQRTSELGVRIALGARPRGVQLLVLRQALLPVASGLLVGAGAAAAGGRILSSLLFDVPPSDVLALGGATLFLSLVAAVAGYVPARRATCIDPASALRAE